MADGIDGPTEADAYDNLYNLVNGYSGFLDILVSKSWVDADDIQSGSPTSASMIEMAAEQVRSNGELTNEIYGFGFLDTLNAGDETLVRALIRINDADTQTYDDLIARPGFAGDIPDGEAAMADVLLEYLSLRLSDDSLLGLDLPWLPNDGDTAFDVFRTAIASPLTVRALLNHYGSEAIHAEIVSNFVQLSEISDTLSARLAVMPFLETFDPVDIEIVEALTRLAATEPDGLAEFLSLYESRGGVMNSDVYGARLAVAEGGIGEVGTALNEMPWYVDGIDTRPRNAEPGYGDAEGQPLYWSQFIPRRNILESEDRVIKRIVEAFEAGQVEPVVALTQRDWMFSSVDVLEFAVIDQLLSVAPNYNLPDNGIIGMPFLATIEESDIATIVALDELSRLVSDQEVIVTSGPFDGGITDDSAHYLQFAMLESLSPEAADTVRPTLQDEATLSPAEHYTVRILKRLAKDNVALLEAILEKEWAQDGFTVDETDVIWELFRMDFYLQEESGYAFTVLEMPFLDDIEPFDKKAVEALIELQWHSVTRLATNFNLFWYVVEHEALSDGIEDDDVLKISVLDEFAVGVRRSDHAQFDASAILEGLDDILLPGAIEIEEGFVQLPNDRRATVRIFRPKTISLAPGTMSELIDLLEYHIELLDTPLDETDYTVVAIAGWGNAHARGEPLSDDRAVYRSGQTRLQGDALAAIGEPFDQTWLGETIRRFGMYSHWNDGDPLTGPENIWEYGNCTQYRSILEALEEDQQRGRNCYTDAGPPLISKLQNNLPRDAFRDGIRAVYSSAREDSYRGYISCPKGSRGICQLWQGFITQATPANAAIAEPIINKWYFGSEQGYVQD